MSKRMPGMTPKGMQAARDRVRADCARGSAVAVFVAKEFLLQLLDDADKLAEQRRDALEFAAMLAVRNGTTNEA